MNMNTSYCTILACIHANKAHSLTRWWSTFQHATPCTFTFSIWNYFSNPNSRLSTEFDKCECRAARDCPKAKVHTFCVNLTRTQRTRTMDLCSMAALKCASYEFEILNEGACMPRWFFKSFSVPFCALNLWIHLTSDITDIRRVAEFQQYSRWKLSMGNNGNKMKIRGLFAQTVFIVSYYAERNKPLTIS